MFDLNPEFINLLEEILPMFIIALILCLIFGWKRVKESYRYEGSISWILQYCISSLMTAVFAIAVILTLPIFVPVDVSYGTKMGIVLYVCVFGIQSVQAFIRKKLGLEIINKDHCQKD